MQLRALLLPCPALPCVAAEQPLGGRRAGAAFWVPFLWANTALRVAGAVNCEVWMSAKRSNHCHSELLLGTSTLVGNPLSRLPWMWRVLLKWSGQCYMAVFMRLYLLNSYLLPAFQGLFSVLLHSSYYRKKGAEKIVAEVSPGAPFVCLGQAMSSSAQNCKWNSWNLGVLSKGTKGEHRIWSPHLSKGSPCRQELFHFLGSL